MFIFHGPLDYDPFIYLIFTYTDEIYSNEIILIKNICTYKKSQKIKRKISLLKN